jgi:hypothetical protein
MLAIRAGRGPIIAIAILTAGLGAGQLRGRRVPPEPVHVFTQPAVAVHVELLSAPLLPARQIEEPPVPPRCCACAMERNEQAWRDQQKALKQRKRRAR